MSKNACSIILNKTFQLNVKFQHNDCRAFSYYPLSSPCICVQCGNLICLKPIFHLATLFARREAKIRIRQRDWLKLAGEKIRREHVGTVPTFLSVRANKVAKWKIRLLSIIMSKNARSIMLNKTVNVKFQLS